MRGATLARIAVAGLLGLAVWVGPSAAASTAYAGDSSGAVAAATSYDSLCTLNVSITYKFSRNNLQGYGSQNCSTSLGTYLQVCTIQQDFWIFGHQIGTCGVGVGYYSMQEASNATCTSGTHGYWTTALGQVEGPCGCFYTKAIRSATKTYSC